MAKKAKTGTKPKKSESSSSGNSNTGLVVTLIFFVIATLILGVFTYLGYTGQTEFQEKANKAAKDTTAANKKAEDEQARRIVFAIASGNDSGTDQTTLAKVKANEGYKATIDLLTKPGTGIVWDANQERPKETYRDTIARLTKEKDQAVEAKNKANTDLNEAKAQFDSMQTSLQNQLAKSKEDMRNAQLSHTQAQQKDHEWYAAQIERIDQESKSLKAEKEAHRTDLQNAEMDKKKLEGRIDDLNKQLAYKNSLIAPPNSLEADTPKGQILRVDRQARTVYINLGSADYVRTNLAFSVLPPSSTGKSAANRDRKGAIEISAVLEPHLSAARIISEASELRDPILPGDLIFNPSWNSGQREHVALAGIFDLDGDGTDDTQEVIRGLERQGIIVDAYVDLRDRTIKGPGITERTTYLVLGEMPKLSQSMANVRTEDNPIAQAVTQIAEKVTELKNAAKEKGVQPVTYQRYLTLVGYPMPKVLRSVDSSSPSYFGKAQEAKAGEAK
jgi:hypothetical protein